VSVGAPDLQRAFGVDYTATALALFVVPTLVGAVVEPPLLVLADRWPRKRFIVGGLLAMGLGSLVAGLTPWFAPFVAAITVWFVGTGIGVDVAQAEVVDAGVGAPERPMLRWVLLGTLGDLAAPALAAGLGALGFGWRGAFVASGAFVTAYALLLATQRFGAVEGDRDEDEGEGDDEPSILEALRRALGNRQLMLWLVGGWTCCLLDELFVVFGSLHLRDALGADLTQRSAILAIDVVGSLVGLWVTARFFADRRPREVLAASAGLCLVSYAAWLAAPSIEASAALVFVVGAATAPLYPYAQAQAYRALPGEPGTVNALEVVFTPLDLAVPLLLGLLADAAGPIAALGVLALQPLTLYVLARTSPR